MLARSRLSLASSLTLDDSSFWYASQQSCPPSPYQPARLALALGLVTPALLLESHTFGSRTCPQRQCKRCAQCVRTCTVCSPVYANRHPTSRYGADLWLEEVCGVQHGASAADEQRRVQAEAVVVACRTDDARRAWVVRPHCETGLALRGVHDLERREGARLAHHLVACRSQPSENATLQGSLMVS